MTSASGHAEFTIDLSQLNSSVSNVGNFVLDSSRLDSHHRSAYANQNQCRCRDNMCSQ